MPQTTKMVKFKTNVSFVASNGVLYFGGNVVQLPQEDYDGQVDVCKDFGLPIPELIEEVEVTVQEDVSTGESEEPKKRGRSTAKSENKSEENKSEEGKSEEGKSEEVKPEADTDL